MKFSEYLDVLEDIDTAEFHRDVERVVAFVKEARSDKAKAFFVGNGGSAATASHFANDFQKAAKLPCVSLSDISTITALANDIAYSKIYSEQINMHGRHGDLLFCISGSGESQNILEAAYLAKDKGLVTITLSGFRPTNTLRTWGYANFYVPSSNWGHVEMAHFAILHHILDRSCV